MKTVLVLGGYGRCGSRMVSLLSSDPEIRCIVEERNPPITLHSTLSQGVDFVINVREDLEKNGVSIAQTCMDSGVHYIDMGTGQEYAAEFLRLNRQAVKKGVCLVTNAGPSPVLSTILADSLVTEFEHITQIHVAYSPGNQSTGSRGSMYDLLKGIGRQIRVKEQGRWHDYPVWGGSKKVNFPSPVGRRRLFLNEAMELEFFPSRYGANTVTFRTGFELSIFNLGISWLAWRKRKKQSKRPEVYAPLLASAAWWLRNFGSDKDALAVLMKGEVSEQEVAHVVYLIGRSQSSLVIPCTPIASLIKKWVNHGVAKPGAVSCQDILQMDDVRLELSQHDIVLVRR